MSDDFDADSIRARRAILISTALAALHCGSPTDEVVPPSTTSTTSTTATADKTSTQKADAQMRPWSEVMKQAPPRGVPAMAEGADKVYLEQTDSWLDTEYEAVRALWESTPRCDPGEDSCKPEWTEAGKKAKVIFDIARGPLVGGCSGAFGQTWTSLTRRQVHKAYISKLVAELEAHLTATAEGYSLQSAQEWLRVLANAKKPPPRPCLSPCAMAEIMPLEGAVFFQKDKAEIRPDESALQAVLATFKANRSQSKIIVRGHADSGESKPAEVALARANAVAAWLVKNGIPKDSIQTKSFDATHPVARNDDESAASQNRRVDFEAVPMKK